MATNVQIKCIHKSNRASVHERITHVGGTNQDGSHWKLTQEQAILGLKEGKWAFYVERLEHRSLPPPTFSIDRDLRL